jgi:hypothetical protein
VLRLQRMRYRAGVVSYLEVLDAERQLNSAEIDDARSQLDKLRAYVELYRALGGGWSEDEIRRLLGNSSELQPTLSSKPSKSACLRHCRGRSTSSDNCREPQLLLKS